MAAMMRFTSFTGIVREFVIPLNSVLHAEVIRVLFVTFVAKVKIFVSLCSLSFP